eukprot:6306094-Heterocapsa_arctica.AAC.1
MPGSVVPDIDWNKFDRLKSELEKAEEDQITLEDKLQLLNVEEIHTLQPEVQLPGHTSSKKSSSGQDPIQRFRQDDDVINLEHELALPPRAVPIGTQGKVERLETGGAEICFNIDGSEHKAW